MTMTWSLLIATVGACFLCQVYGATFVVTAPKRPYFDSEFTVSVSAHDVFAGDKVTLTYKKLYYTRHVLHRKTLTFHVDEVQTWGVVFNSSKIAEFKEAGVMLEVSGLGRKKQLYLEFSDNTGYIFIQTDKPLYTPRQKVKFRVIALDEYQRISTYPLKVDIKNPHSVIVDRLRFYPKDAFKAQELDLPPEVTLGNWTITATYEGLGGQASKVYTRIFEIREYVLPRFTTVIDVNPKIITDETELVTITAISKYTSGRSVLGLAEVQIGMWFPSQQRTFILEEQYIEELKRGKLKMTFNIKDLIPEGLINEKRKRLFINVTVTETGTMETDTVTDDSVLVFKPFYTASFEGSNMRFKPGFNYSIQGHVTDAVDNKAVRLALNMKVTFKDDKDMIIDRYQSQVTTDGSGGFFSEFKTPPSGHIMVIKVDE